MKTVRLIKDDVLLWNFIKSKLPDSLRAETISSGYGCRHVIYRKEYRRSLCEKIFDYEKEGSEIAEVFYDTITLHAPEYYSDFEDICRAFEAATKTEATLKYWESR